MISKVDKFILLHITSHNKNKFFLISSVSNFSLYSEGINNNNPISFIPSIINLYEFVSPFDSSLDSLTIIFIIKFLILIF